MVGVGGSIPLVPTIIMPLLSCLDNLKLILYLCFLIIRPMVRHATINNTAPSDHEQSAKPPWDADSTARPRAWDNTKAKMPH